MKKITLLGAIFCMLSAVASSQTNCSPSPELIFPKPVFFSNQFILRASVYWWRPIPAKRNFLSLDFATTPINYRESHEVSDRHFSAMQYHYPKGVIFCRMENATAKRLGFMLSIHAGGYTER
jgi:hypothetical protein